MKKAHRQISHPTKTSGFSIVELMVAIGILAGSMIMLLTIVQSGIGILSDMKVKNQIRECARLAMEYYSSIPPDVVYAMSKNTAREGDFMSGLAGNDDMASFVVDTYPTCKNLSDPGNPIGQQVQLKYTVCPGCFTYKDPDPTVEFSTCIYYMKLRMTYNGRRYGGAGQTLDYMQKIYTGQSGDCDTALNSNGCGASAGGEQHNACNF